MAKQVVMPQMGESVAEGTIVRWLKKVGDAVERDEPLFEISTDKVDAEIPSPAAGVLSEVKVKEGETVPINTVVARHRRDRVQNPRSARQALPPPRPALRRTRRRTSRRITHRRSKPHATVAQLSRKATAITQTLRSHAPPQSASAHRARRRYRAWRTQPPRTALLRTGRRDKPQHPLHPA